MKGTGHYLFIIFLKNPKEMKIYVKEEKKKDREKKHDDTRK